MEYGTIGPGWESWHALTPCLEATDKYHPGGPELHALELFNRKESNPSDRESYEGVATESLSPSSHGCSNPRLMIASVPLAIEEVSAVREL